MKVTIKDIAREADVSVSAVSLVLNRKPCRVSTKTQKRIFEVAEKYKYQVNQAARSLVTRQSKIIGMIIPDIENLFFSSLSKKVEEYCRERGYMLIIVNTNDKEEDDIRVLDMLISRGVDGLLITPSNESVIHGNSLIEKLESIQIPYVLVDRYFKQLKANKVYFDNEEGARLAITHLVSLGHTKIGCIGSGNDSKNGQSRVVGYQKAMQEHGLVYCEDDIFDGNYRFEGGYEAGAFFMKKDISALFISNDMMTLGFLRYMQEQHLQNKVDIVSYDNTINRFLPGNQITSIDQDISILSHEACTLLFDSIHDNTNQKEIVLHPQLIIKNE